MNVKYLANKRWKCIEIARTFQFAFPFALKFNRQNFSYSLTLWAYQNTNDLISIGVSVLPPQKRYHHKKNIYKWERNPVTIFRFQITIISGGDCFYITKDNQVMGETFVRGRVFWALKNAHAFDHLNDRLTIVSSTQASMTRNERWQQLWPDRVLIKSLAIMSRKDRILQLL